MLEIIKRRKPAKRNRVRTRHIIVDMPVSRSKPDKGPKLVNLSEIGRSHREHFISRKMTSIGLAAHCDLQLTGSSIQNTHCLLVDGGNSLYRLRNLGEARTVAINGIKVSEAQEIKDRDILRIGTISFQFRAA